VFFTCVRIRHPLLKSSTNNGVGDEVKKVRTRVPRSIILTCTVNSAMLIIFATILLFYMGPLEDVIATPLPILWVIYNITGSSAAANVLVSILVIIIGFALFNIFASVSRLIWVFARDNGLPFSKFFAYVCSLGPMMLLS
jgi:choline transport protein